MSTANDTAALVYTPSGWLVWHKTLEAHYRMLEEERAPVDQNGTPLVQGHQRGWWIAAERPLTVSFERLWYEAVGAWKLTKPELHAVDPARWPLEIPDADWDWETWSSDDYARDAEKQTETFVIDLADATVIESVGVPPGTYNGTWVPDLVPSVLNRPEFAPWLPGRLTGFRAHVAETVEKMPHVTDVYCKRRGSSYEPGEGPYFKVRQLWEPPRTVTAHPNGDRRRKKQTTETFVTVKVPLSDVLLSIRGSSLVDAISNWDAALAETLASFEEIGVKACGHCDGKGWVQS